MLHSALFQELSCIHSALLTLDADEHTGIAPVLPHVLTRVSLLPLMAHFHYTVGLGHARYGSVRLGRVGP